MNIEELITHTNIIIEEGLDSEDDIQSMLKKWKTAYEKEKEKNKNARERIEYYLVENMRLNDFDERNKELRKLEKMLEE